MNNFITTFLITIVFFLFFSLFIFILEKILFFITNKINILYKLWKNLKKK
jgi:hypothetical protein